MVGKLGDMYEPVLFDADIHKGSKIHHIPHRARKLHAFTQIFELEHVMTQDRGGKGIARVQPRLLQVIENIGKGRYTYSKFPSEIGNAGIFLGRTAGYGGEQPPGAPPLRYLLTARIAR